jgi:hypothetical protein
VDSSSDEDDRLLESFWSAFLREKFLIKQLFVLVLLVELIVRSDSQQMNIPFLWAFDQHFLIEVKLLSAVVLVQGLQKFDVISVSVGIGKGKLHLLILIFEVKVKAAL